MCKRCRYERIFAEFDRRGDMHSDGQFDIYIKGDFAKETGLTQETLPPPRMLALEMEDYATTFDRSTMFN